MLRFGQTLVGHCRRVFLLGVLGSIAGITACQPEPSQSTGDLHAAEGPSTIPLRSDSLPPDDGQWVRPAKDYASTRFSGLAEITAQNVKDLRLVSTFSTGVLRGHEEAPIVANNTMYIITPFPNIV